MQVLALGLFLWGLGVFVWAGWADPASLAFSRALLSLDPMVGISAAMAGRLATSVLCWTAGGLVLALLMPRFFCGYLCPLGTLIDGFDAAIGRWLPWTRRPTRPAWANLHYIVLVVALASAASGAALCGYLAPIPLLARGLLSAAAPANAGFWPVWNHAVPMATGMLPAVAALAAVLSLGLLKQRFWCRYLCPSGACFSAVSLLRASERKVTSACVACGKCIKSCPFGAVKPDYSTRHADCAFCQTCGGACPVAAIQFGPRWRNAAPEPAGVAGGAQLSRRELLLGAFAGAAAVASARLNIRSAAQADAVVRPPGSLPEGQFLQLCTRCGECIKACPTHLLQPMGLGNGLGPVWTPRAGADAGGCAPDCARCGQACPTGAIRRLDVREKQAARMGLAGVDMSTCLAYTGKSQCLLCQVACAQAGYGGIEAVARPGATTTSAPAETSAAPATQPAGGEILVPRVDPLRCVGCGNCQHACYTANVRGPDAPLSRAAITVLAGPGREDRMAKGSYVELRRRRDDGA